MTISALALSYPNFVLGTIIDPDEANQNNFDIVNKINEIVSQVDGYATEEYVDAIASGFVLNEVSDGSITKVKLHSDLQGEVDSAVAHMDIVAEEEVRGHIKLSDIPTTTKEDVGLNNVDNLKQLPIGGGTMTGSIDFDGNKAENPEIKNYLETCVVDDSGSEYTFDLADGNAFEITLTDNCTFTMPPLPDSGKVASFTVRLKQDGTGDRTPTFTSALYAEGDTPDFSTDPSKIDKIVFTGWSGASGWEGDLVGVDYS